MCIICNSDYDPNCPVCGVDEGFYCDCCGREFIECYEEKGFYEEYPDEVLCSDCFDKKEVEYLKEINERD